MLSTCTAQSNTLIQSLQNIFFSKKRVVKNWNCSVYCPNVLWQLAQSVHVEEATRKNQCAWWHLSTNTDIQYWPRKAWIQFKGFNYNTLIRGAGFTRCFQWQQYFWQCAYSIRNRIWSEVRIVSTHFWQAPMSATCYDGNRTKVLPICLQQLQLFCQ